MKAKKSDLKQYLNIVSSIFIEHAAFAFIKEELESAYDSVSKGGNPVCTLITGESRTGKSSVVRLMLKERMLDVSDGQSVVYAIAPAKATTKSLLEALLKGMGDPYWHRGSESNMTQRLYTLLEKVKCRLIILDEFQHLCDKGQRKQLTVLADWLKVLVEGGQWGLVAVGLPESASIVHCHPQLQTRFQPEMKMPVFDWTEKNSRVQFRGILKQFRLDLIPFELPPIEGEALALRVYLATAGRVGLVARLLDRVVKDAIREDHTKIGLEDLQVAYDRAIWGASRFPVKGGPFLGSETEITGKQVLASVLKVAARENVADTSAKVEIHGPAADEAAEAPSTRGCGRAPAGRTNGIRASQRRNRMSRKATRELGRAL